MHLDTFKTLDILSEKMFGANKSRLLKRMNLFGGFGGLRGEGWGELVN